MFALAATFLFLAATTGTADGPVRKRFPKFEETRVKAEGQQAKRLERATFGGGCFWCTEAVFESVKGVTSVESGYCGGALKNPTYQQVLTGRTGHAEVVQITYDPAEISFPELLEIFWSTHDPTTLNRQGPDKGTQYRSVIFCHSDEQLKLAQHYKVKLDESKAYRGNIVTQVSKAMEFYPAEKYHQDFYELNRRNSYCSRYIRPKMKKLRLVFSDKLE